MTHYFAYGSINGFRQFSQSTSAIMIIIIIKGRLDP